jgi:hypothetical protein
LLFFLVSALLPAGPHHPFEGISRPFEAINSLGKYRWTEGVLLGWNNLNGEISRRSKGALLLRLSKSH